MESAYAGSGTIGNMNAKAMAVESQRYHAAQTAPRDMTELEVLGGKLQTILAFAGEQGAAVEQICEKLTGGYPMAAESQAGKPIGGGTIGVLNVICDAIMTRLQTTSESVGRLRNAI